ncbi:MAG: helix-turn-helix transcriptional regulator [Gammaproteobacteria bacterium]
MLTAHLLALLKGWSAYGYELAHRLEESGFGEMNKGSIYRLLRQMERSGLVSSDWDTSADGPARRVYSLTDAGNLFLNNWLAFLDAHRRGLEQLAALAGGLESQASNRKGQKKS